MEESLKTVRLIQRTLLVISGAILLLAVSPDPSIPYRNALPQLRAITSLDADNYDSLAISHESDQKDRFGFVSAIARRAIRLVQADVLQMDTTFNVRYRARMATNPRNLSLANLYEFLKNNQDVIIIRPDIDASVNSIDRWIKNNAPELISDSDSKLNFKLIEITYDAHEWIIGIELSRGNAKPRAFKIRPTQVFEEREKIDPLLWFIKQVPTAASEDGTLFHNLIPIWNEISGATPFAAVSIVNLRIKESARNITLFGFSVSEEWAGIVAPLITASVLIFLLLHVQHIRRTLANQELTASTFPWIDLFPTRTAIVLTAIMVLAFPVGANALLLVRSGNTVIAIVVSVVLSWFALGVLTNTSRIRKALTSANVIAQPDGKIHQ